ncbi:HAD hydrolase-like protein [Patescibacteria group bacterium]|nr:HAD hydrolase-like protein [Patescibacteria group bacterium]MBU4338425.1 HAD hydrolase-like protein [Patescibacteria group bacterium]MBU4579484.1 HAD hydrolase-like protein [Patescibacteria group bacterium]
MNDNIKFIYLDVGGVVVLDFSKTNNWIEMTKALGVNEFNRKKFDNIFFEFEPKICVNKKTLGEFIDAVNNELKLNISKDYSMLDDFVNRFESNISINPILLRLSKNYKLGLLTNMYPGMFDKIRARKILPEVRWDIIIDSSVVGCMKPQDNIYELAEKKVNSNSKNILFIENTITHINAAKKRGWKTLLYDPANISSSNSALEKMLF